MLSFSLAEANTQARDLRRTQSRINHGFQEMGPKHVEKLPCTRMIPSKWAHNPKCLMETTSPMEPLQVRSTDKQRMGWNSAKDKHRKLAVNSSNIYNKREIFGIADSIEMSDFIKRTCSPKRGNTQEIKQACLRPKETGRIHSYFQSPCMQDSLFLGLKENAKKGRTVSFETESTQDLPIMNRPISTGSSQKQQCCNIPSTTVNIVEKELLETYSDIDLDSFSVIDPSDLDTLFEEGDIFRSQEENKVELTRKRKKQRTVGSMSNDLETFLEQPVATDSVSQKAHVKKPPSCFHRHNAMFENQQLTTSFPTNLLLGSLMQEDTSTSSFDDDSDIDHDSLCVIDLSDIDSLFEDKVIFQSKEEDKELSPTKRNKHGTEDSESNALEAYPPVDIVSLSQQAHTKETLSHFLNQNKARETQQKTMPQSTKALLRSSLRNDTTTNLLHSDLLALGAYRGAKSEHTNSIAQTTDTKRTVDALFQSMCASLMSQEIIQRWDKKMGLKRSHSATMTKTSLSRKQLNHIYTFNVSAAKNVAPRVRGK